MNKPTERVFTGDDEANARLIGILMSAAKMLQATYRALANGAVPGAVGGDIHAFFLTVIQLSPGGGDQLEKDTLALAARVGFVVEQHFISPGSAVPQ